MIDILFDFCHLIVDVVTLFLDIEVLVLKIIATNQASQNFSGDFTSLGSKRPLVMVLL